MTRPHRTSNEPAPALRSELETLRGFIIGMFVAGALIPALTLALEPASPARTIGFVTVAVLMAASAVVVWAVRPPRQRLFEAMAAWATLLIGANIALMPAVGIMPVYLLWPVVLVAYFSTRRMVVVSYLWTMLVLVVAVALNPPDFGYSDVLIGMGATLAIMAGIVNVVTRRHQSLRDELQIAATTDPLTGLLNRRAFLPWLAEAVGSAREQEEPLCVVMLDLDHFKSINDKLGHFGGDRVLVAVADALRQQSRADDVLCRFGGEEFAVGLPGASVVEAKAYATRVAAGLAVAGEDEGCVLTTSVGIAALAVDSSVDDLLRSADDALYAAKRAGRNRAAVWDSEARVEPVFDVPS